MNSNKIEIALYNHFNFLNNDIISNVFLDFNRYECDLMVITKSLYVSEVEIKISVSDLRAESKKQRYKLNGYHNPNFSVCDFLKHKWFAMPEEMEKQGLELIPKYSGLLCVNEKMGVKIVKKPEKLSDKKISNEQRTDFLRIGNLKVFTLKNRILELEKKLERTANDIIRQC